MTHSIYMYIIKLLCKYSVPIVDVIFLEQVREKIVLFFLLLDKLYFV